MGVSYRTENRIFLVSVFFKPKFLLSRVFGLARWGGGGDEE